jgi:hypothetical protein
LPHLCRSSCSFLYGPTRWASTPGVHISTSTHQHRSLKLTPRQLLAHQPGTVAVRLGYSSLVRSIGFVATCSHPANINYTVSSLIPATDSFAHRIVLAHPQFTAHSTCYILDPPRPRSTAPSIHRALDPPRPRSSASSAAHYTTISVSNIPLHSSIIVQTVCRNCNHTLAAVGWRLCLQRCACVQVIQYPG